MPVSVDSARVRLAASGLEPERASAVGRRPHQTSIVRLSKPFVCCCERCKEGPSRKMVPALHGERLEEEFQGELDLARGICGTNRAIGCVRSPRIGNAEVSVVQQVEKLRSKLEPEVFPNDKGFVGRKVPLLKIEGAERIAAEIAKGSAGGRRRECVASKERVQHLRRRLTGRAASYVRT